MPTVVDAHVAQTGACPNAPPGVLQVGEMSTRLCPLEDALRNKAVLFAGTEHGVRKQGVRNEIQIAHTGGIGDAEFVIPLRLTNFDAP